MNEKKDTGQCEAFQGNRTARSGETQTAAHARQQLTTLPLRARQALWLRLWQQHILAPDTQTSCNERTE
jgi:hypothetical protein